MSDEERRAVVLTTTVLLLASLLRFGWEARPIPPILPQAEVPEELLRETRLAVERQERMNTPLASGELVDPNRGPDVELARGGRFESCSAHRCKTFKCDRLQ